MQLSLPEQYNTIALEAHAGESSLQQAITRLPNFFKDVTTTLGNAFKVPFNALFNAKDLTWAGQVVDKHDYATLRTVEMPCVPGLKSDYLTYIDALHEAAVFCTHVRADYVQTLIDFLAKKLANPDALKSRAPDSSLATIRLDPIEALHASLSELVDPALDTAVQPYGKLFRRNADWATLVHKAKVIHNAFSREDHDRFERSVERCQELLGTLLTRLNQHPDLYQLSPQTLDTISKNAYVVATAVEFYGLTYHRANVLDHALDQLVEKVKTLT